MNGTNSVDEKNAIQRQINEIVYSQEFVSKITKAENKYSDTNAGSDSEEQILGGFFGIDPNNVFDPTGLTYQVGEGGGSLPLDSLDNIDAMISNVNRMHSTINGKYSYFQAKFDHLEEEKIAFSKSKSHFTDADMTE